MGELREEVVAVPLPGDEVGPDEDILVAEAVVVSGGVDFAVFAVLPFDGLNRKGNLEVVLGDGGIVDGAETRAHDGAGVTHAHESADGLAVDIEAACAKRQGEEGVFAGRALLLGGEHIHRQAVEQLQVARVFGTQVYTCDAGRCRQ